MAKLPSAPVTTVIIGLRIGSEEAHRACCSSAVSSAKAATRAPPTARPSLPTTVPVIAPSAAIEERERDIARNAARTRVLRLRRLYIMPDLSCGRKGGTRFARRGDIALA